MTKFIEKAIEYCDQGCPYYRYYYDNYYSEFCVNCVNGEEKTIYKNSDLYKEVEVPFGPKKCNLTKTERVFNDDMFPIIPPEWCPLKDIKSKGVKVGMAALFIEDDKILMGKRLGDSVMCNQWAFPGGKMDLFEESLLEGLKREVKEETSMILKEADLICYQNEYFPEIFQNYIVFYFLAKEYMGKPKNMEPHKCSGWEWVDINNLPKDVSKYALQVIKIGRYKSFTQRCF